MDFRHGELQAARTTLVAAIDSHAGEVSRPINELMLATAARHATLASTSWRLTAFKLILRPRFPQF